MSAVTATSAGFATNRFEVPRTRLRLTTRGRAVFTVLGALPLVLWAALSVLGAGAAAADDAIGQPGASFDYVTVGAGDTLWEIAEAADPGADPRVVIDDIIRLNGLDSSVVEPGQRLALPAQ
ncbi:LysM peptidoglycan-binding domain-containing protein [Agromyces mediolanus]|uniref:LysM peptidoglycan-binding domain-containing protein n=1 Tax=Agromyces mediolanus TaxID=41986 RepID=UPI0038364AF2